MLNLRRVLKGVVGGAVGWGRGQDRSDPNFPPFLTSICPFVPEIVQMRHYELTPGRRRRIGRE
jgi:hypothetical protein